MNQPLRVSEPPHHFHECPVSAKPSDVQQCGYHQCGHEHQWWRGNHPSLLLHHRWDHCYAQYHDWHHILDFYNGYELWVYLDSVSIPHPLHQCFRHPCDPRFGRAYGHSTCFVLWIQCDWYHSKSTSDPGVLVPHAFLRSQDCQPQQQPFSSPQSSLTIPRSITSDPWIISAYTS